MAVAAGRPQGPIAHNSPAIRHVVAAVTLRAVQPRVRLVKLEARIRLVVERQVAETVRHVVTACAIDLLGRTELSHVWILMT